MGGLGSEASLEQPRLTDGDATWGRPPLPNMIAVKNVSVPRNHLHPSFLAFYRTRYLLFGLLRSSWDEQNCKFVFSGANLLRYWSWERWPKLPSKPKQIYEKKTRKHLCCQKYILPRHWQCIRCALWYRVLLQGVQVLSNPILWCNLVGVGALISHKYTSGRINIWKHTVEKNQTNASGLRDYEGMHLSQVLAFIKKIVCFSCAEGTQSIE